VADETSLELALRAKFEPAGQRTGVERQLVIDEKGARPVLRGFAPMTPDDAKIHPPAFTRFRHGQKILVPRRQVYRDRPPTVKKRTPRRARRASVPKSPPRRQSMSKSPPP